MIHFRWALGGVSLLALLMVGPAANSDDAKTAQSNRGSSGDNSDRAVAKASLSQFQDLVGGWNGTGQPKRGSAAGAWREKGDWRWKFEGDTTALEYQVADGKLLVSALLSFNPKDQSFRLKTVEPIEGKDEKAKREYVGSLADKKLIFESVGEKNDDVRRITITRLNEKRTLVLFERKGASQNFFSRVAEVGYTREGTRLAESDQTGPECVVTGGVGTIQVKFKGETYWVCCTGCRDAFNDDPEGVLADYAKRLEERKAKK